MKRVYLTATGAVLGIALIAGMASAMAAAHTAVGISAGQQQQASPAQVREEYDAYMAAYNSFYKDHDFQKSWDLANTFVTKYPSSQYLAQAKTLSQQSKYAVYQVGLQNRNYEKVFPMGKEFLGEDPDNVTVLLQLAIAAGTLAKSNDFKYQTEGVEYGHKAIALIEAGKIPNGMNEADWAAKHKNGLLGQLYQISGLFAEKAEKTDEAIEDLKKSADIDASDPVTFYLLGRVHFRKYGDYANEYRKLRDQYSAMTDDQKISDDGKAVLAKVEEHRGKVDSEADMLIDAYAHVLGMTDGRPEFDAIRNEISPNLEKVYMYRNNGKTDGLGEKIKSFKGATAAASPQPAL